MVSVDMRTRLDADVVLIDTATFVADDLPELIERNGELAVRGAALVGAKALGIDVEGIAFTFEPTDRTIELRLSTSVGADLGSVRENAHRNVGQTPAALQH